MRTVRLARFLARAGVASRRGVVPIIKAGRVTVNGAAPVGPGDPIDPERDRVAVDGRALASAPIRWLALHKPAGYVTSRRAAARHPSVFALLAAAPPGLITVGRLDVYSEGILLGTTDGAAAHRLMHPRWRVPRRYRVLVTGRLDRAGRSALTRGVPLEGDAPVRPTRWRFATDGRGGELELELLEGRSRVVRRMAAALGWGVRRLVRVAYGPVRLGNLPAGASRPLTPREIRALYRAVSLPEPPSADGRAQRWT